LLYRRSFGTSDGCCRPGLIQVLDSHRTGISRNLSALSSAGTLPRLHEVLFLLHPQTLSAALRLLVDASILIGEANGWLLPGASLEASVLAIAMACEVPCVSSPSQPLLVFLVSPPTLVCVSLLVCQSPHEDQHGDAARGSLRFPRSSQDPFRVESILDPLSGLRPKALPRLTSGLAARRVVFVRPAFPVRCRPTTRADYTHRDPKRKRKIPAPVDFLK
jgi:hypothetical protein